MRPDRRVTAIELGAPHSRLIWRTDCDGEFADATGNRWVPCRVSLRTGSCNSEFEQEQAWRRGCGWPGWCCPPWISFLVMTTKGHVGLQQRAEQLTLAEFITSAPTTVTCGRMRLRYRRRRNQLIAALAQRWGPSPRHRRVCRTPELSSNCTRAPAIHRRSDPRGADWPWPG